MFFRSTVNLFNFASDLFCKIRETERFAKINRREYSVRPLYYRICITNEKRNANVKIHRREMTFHQHIAKINSLKKK